MIDISKSLDIQGWMSKAELQWLGEQAKTHEAIVEIGCFLGRSTRVLAENTPGYVCAVDDFYGPRDTEISEEDRDRIFSIFVQNTSDLENVIKIIADHRNERLDCLPGLEGIEPDMVFIDGDHSYQNVKRDICFWKPKLSIGGLLAGHDITLPEVYQAVSELLKFETVPGTTIWTAI